MRVLILGSAFVLVSLQGMSHVASTLQQSGLTISGSNADGLFTTSQFPNLFRNSVAPSGGNQPCFSSDTPQVRTNPQLTHGLRPADGGSPVTGFAPGRANARY